MNTTQRFYSNHSLQFPAEAGITSGTAGQREESTPASAPIMSPFRLPPQNGYHRAISLPSPHYCNQKTKSRTPPRAHLPRALGRLDSRRMGCRIDIMRWVVAASLLTAIIVLSIGQAVAATTTSSEEKGGPPQIAALQREFTRLKQDLPPGFPGGEIAKLGVWIDSYLRAPHAYPTSRLYKIAAQLEYVKALKHKLETEQALERLEKQIERTERTIEEIEATLTDIEREIRSAEGADDDESA